MTKVSGTTIDYTGGQSLSQLLNLTKENLIIADGTKTKNNDFDGKNIYIVHPAQEIKQSYSFFLV